MPGLPRRARIRNVQAVVRDVVAEIDKLANRAAIDIYPVLGVAERELKKDLTRWLATVENGADRFTAQRYQTMLLQIKSARLRIEQTQDGLGAVMKRHVVTASELAIRNLTLEVSRLSHEFGDAIPRLRFDIVTRLRRNDMLWERFETSAARYSGRLGNSLVQQLRIGVIRNETFDEMARRLTRGVLTKGTRLGGALGEPAAIVDGITSHFFRPAQFWAERLVRTEMMNAYNDHHSAELRELAEDDPEFKQRWDATADYRVCSTCRALDGEVAAIGQAFSVGVMQPPAHPQCRCVVVPWKEHWGDIPRVPRGVRPQNVYQSEQELVASNR